MISDSNINQNTQDDDLIVGMSETTQEEQQKSHSQKIISFPIKKQMESDFYDYSMSVIQDRALPDIRDGFKPVQRRILYTMYGLKCFPNSAAIKSARIIGEVLGKYHPHGDTAVYGAMVAMAQDFNKKLPLVEGQGNFGSVDGDNAAAMRYCFTADTYIMTEKGMITFDEINMYGENTYEEQEQIKFKNKEWYSIDKNWINDVNKLSTDYQKDQKKYGICGKEINLNVVSLAGNEYYQKAHKYIFSGLHETVKITTKNGYEVTCTPNEPLYCFNKKTNQFDWKRVDNIDLGDNIALNKICPNVKGNGFKNIFLKLQKINKKNLDNNKINLELHLENQNFFKNKDKKLFSEVLNGLSGNDMAQIKENSFYNFGYALFISEMIDVVNNQSRNKGLVSRKIEKVLTDFLNNVDGNLEDTLTLTNFLQHMDKDDLYDQLEEILIRTSTEQLALFFNGYNYNQLFSLLEQETSKNNRKKLFIKTNSKKISKLFKQLLINYFGIMTGNINNEENHFVNEVNKVIDKYSENQIYIEEFDLSGFKVEELSHNNEENLDDINIQISIEKDKNLESDIYEFPHEFNMENELYLMEILNVSAYTKLIYKQKFNFNSEPKNDFYNKDEIVSIDFNHNNRKKVPVFDLTVENTNAFIANGFVAHNTEARLTKVSYNGLFKDLDKDVVNFVDNYDGTESEPSVLPVSFPQLWVNGVDGIAVGVATYIPPHNLNEVIDVTLALQENPDLSIDEIIKIMPAPDFPTGGVVHQLSGYKKALETGTGTVKVKSKYIIEENKFKKSSKSNHKILVITEIPYKINKLKLFERIQEALRKKTYPELNDYISLIQDESDKDGIRIAIYLKGDANNMPELVFNNLVKNFALEESYSYNCVVLDENKKHKTVGIKELLQVFLDFRKEVLLKRSQYLLNKANNELHVLEAFMVVLADVDNVIVLIKSHKNGKEANEALQAKYGLDEGQAQEILNIRLQKLTSTELDVIKNNYEETKERIADLIDFMNSNERIQQTIKNDLIDFKDKFGKECPRKTEISYADTSLSKADFIKKEDCLIVLTKDGYVKRLPIDEIHTQNRNGKGKQSINMYDGDSVKTLLNASTHDNVFFFTKSGKIYGNKAWDLPESDKGRHVKNLFELIDSEIVSIICFSDEELEKDKLSVITVSKNGKIKRSSASQYASALRLKAGLIGFKLEEEDDLITVLSCKDNDHLMIVTSDNVVNRFVIDDNNFRKTGRSALGVDGVKLSKNEEVIDAMIVEVNESDIIYKKETINKYIQDDNGDIKMIGKMYRIDGTEDIDVLDTSLIDKDKYLLTISENGVGKKVNLSEFKLQKRKAKGLKLMKENTKTGKLIKTEIVTDENEIVITTENKTIKISVKDIADLGRMAGGSYLMNVNDDNVVDIVIV